jgi:hypothetical protein
MLEIAWLNQGQAWSSDLKGKDEEEGEEGGVVLVVVVVVLSAVDAQRLIATRSLLG